MNRLHVHLHVHDIAHSVRFYSALFGAAPVRRESDYAKWMLEDPRVNFAISTGGDAGLGHLGIQVEDAHELARATARAKDATDGVFEEAGARCCYAVSDKVWATDPQGVRWETFHTTGDLTAYGIGAARGRDPRNLAIEESAGCCAPASPKSAPAPCCAGQ